MLRLRDLLTPGPVDQKESPSFYGSEEPYPRLSERSDVLVYQTAPLTEAVEVTGRMTVSLWVSSSREVFLEAGVPVPVTIELPPTSNLFDVGHRIRVDISSSNWPRLDVNPNTGEPMGRHTRQVTAEQVV